MLKWLFVIDPLEKINPLTDTSYVIMKESVDRNIEVLFCTIDDLFFAETVGCIAKRTLFNEAGEIHGESQQKISLDDFNLIFMRKDPPYDIKYHYATQLLSITKSKVVNAPESLRRFNEKLIIFYFPDLIPPTLVTSDRKTIQDFLNQHGAIVLKLLDTYQGKQVQKIENIEEIPDLKEPVMVQKFLSNIIKGDKRVLVLGGKFIGAVNRIPQKGFISNFGAGGIGIKATMNEKEMKIVEKIGPYLLQNQIYFAGLDLIDEYLTEINITCPTGVQQINRLENKKLEKDIVDYFLKISS